MPSPAKRQFEAIGTQWELVTSTALQTSQWDEIQRTIEEFDVTYSRFRPDSLVAKVTAKAGTYTFPPNFETLFSLYEKLYTATDGRMSPLVGNTLASLGYDAEYSLRPKSSIAPTPKLETITRKGSTITTQEPVTLDIGAAGKGFLIDSIAALLENYQQEYVIDGSGDIRVSAAWHERIGLENPHDQTRVLGMVDLRGQSLCGSASNRRAWGSGLHHIIDPHTGEPTQNVQATWVVADSAFVADGLATALFFVSPDKLNDFDFTYVRIMHDNTVEYSSNFSGELYV
jgi:thiamine biosynthesis lipoprotein